MKKILQNTRRDFLKIVGSIVALPAMLKSDVQEIETDDVEQLLNLEENRNVEFVCGREGFPPDIVNLRIPLDNYSMRENLDGGTTERVSDLLQKDLFPEADSCDIRIPTYKSQADSLEEFKKIYKNNQEKHWGNNIPVRIISEKKPANSIVITLVEEGDYSGVHSFQIYRGDNWEREVIEDKIIIIITPKKTEILWGNKFFPLEFFNIDFTFPDFVDDDSELGFKPNGEGLAIINAKIKR